MASASLQNLHEKFTTTSRCGYPISKIRQSGPRLRVLRQRSESDTKKALFIAETGCMGLGRGVEPGDEVCILFGEQAPFLLREAESGMFELIEDSYINSWMERGAIKE